MALPDNVLSSQPELAAYTYTSLIEEEMGGVALNDSSAGLEVQLWRVFLEGDSVKLSTGGGPAQVAFTQAGIVRELSLAFDQNMNPVVAFETEDGKAWWWWFDTLQGQMTFSELPTGSKSPRVTLDDRRARQIQNSDVLLVYIRGGGLYYRQQRDRYLAERMLLGGLEDGIRVGNVSMNDSLRIQIQLFDWGAAG